MSLTREEHRFRTFENRVLRKILGPKREEVAGGWRSLHNEELHNLYASPNIIRGSRTLYVQIKGSDLEFITNSYRIWPP
jgi:hypothetical protein